MNVLNNIWSDLVEKRLWPVAALLVAALVAFPMMLAKPGEPTATATIPPPIEADDSGPQLDLTRASTTGFGRAPRVNDKRLDPFGARYNKAFEDALAAYLKSADSVIGESTSGGTDTSSSGTTTTGTDGGGVTPVVTDPGDGGGDTPTATPKPTPKPETEKDDLLTVLFTSDDATEPKEITDIRTLSPLPDTENPFLVYVGKTSDGKVSFLVSADVTVSGDGTCAPSTADCRTLVMKVGDTADFVLLTQENKKVSVTVTDLEPNKTVLVDDTATDDTAATGTTQSVAQLESATRAIGAKALKTVIRDEVVLESLIENGVKIRTK